MSLHEKWIIKRTLVHADDISKLVVEAGLVDKKEPYWSVTATEYDNFCFDDCVACGCMHDDILKHFPELQPVIDVHLSDTNGAPMHALANAKYFYEQKEWKRLFNHLRWSDSNMDKVNKAFSSNYHGLVEFLDKESHSHGNVEMVLILLVKNVLAPMWKLQAKRAREVLESLNDSTDTETPFEKKIREHGIKSEIDEEGFDGNYLKYKVRLRMGRRSMTVPFMCGIAYGEVTTAAVFGSVLRDANSVSSANFDEFCCMFGYDTDSREAEKNYKACVSMDKKLKKFLGEEYNSFMNQG